MSAQGIAGMNRRLHTPSEQIQDDRARRRNFAFVMIVAVLAITASHLTAIYVAHFNGIEEGRRIGCAIPKATPQPTKALTQWTCDVQEGRERAFACASRIRMEKVGQLLAKKNEK